MAVFICFFTLLQMQVLAQNGSLKGLLRGPKSETVADATIILSNVEKRSASPPTPTKTACSSSRRFLPEVVTQLK